jgi:hypothetical protein
MSPTTAVRLAAACLGAAFAFSAFAQSTVQPIAIGEAKDHSGCFIYLKADGSRLLFQAKPIAARGDCPPDFQRGTVVRFGAETYRMQIPAKNADCVITPGGFGRCMPGVIDDRPDPVPPATQETQSAPPAALPQEAPAQQ